MGDVMETSSYINSCLASHARLRSLGSVNQSANPPLSANPEDRFSNMQSAASIFGTIRGSIQQPRWNSNSAGHSGNTKPAAGFPPKPFRSDFGISQTADGLAQHPWWKSNFASQYGSTTAPAPNLLGKNETRRSAPGFTVVTSGNLVQPDATTIIPSPFGIATGFSWTIMPGLSAGNTCEDCRKSKVSRFAPTVVPSEGHFLRLQSISAVPGNEDKSHEELRWENCLNNRMMQGKVPVMMLPVIPMAGGGFAILTAHSNVAEPPSIHHASQVQPGFFS